MKLIIKIIIIIIIIVWFILFFNFTKNNSFSHYDIRDIDINELQTGDILLIDYQTVGNFFITSIFGEKFMHPVIIIKEDHEIYFLEYTTKSITKRKLSKWLEKNQDNMILLNKLHINNENLREELKNKLIMLYNEYKDILGPAAAFKLDWTRFWWPSKNFVKPVNFERVTCTEITALILKEADVIKKNKSIESYLPRSYIGMEGFDCNEGYEYKEKFLINNLFF